MPDSVEPRWKAAPADLARVVIATLLFSFVGPLAKLVRLDVGTICFYRALFASLALGAALFSGAVRVPVVFPSGRALFLHIGLGILMCGNWYFYLLAVQVSNVALAVVALFTYPLFTALLEPLIFRQRYRLTDLFAGVLVFLGIVLVVERFSLSHASAQGVLYGLIASVSLTFRNLFSRRALSAHSAEVLNLTQFLVVGVAFLPFALGHGALPGLFDLTLLATIGGALTAASWVLFTAALRGLTTTVASFLVSLQPAFATVIAWMILREVPSVRTVLGGAVILAGVLFALYGHRSASAPE